jgi:hypothetical protein
MALCLAPFASQAAAQDRPEPQRLEPGGAATVTTSLELFASDTGRGMLFYPGALIGLL